MNQVLVVSGLASQKQIKKIFIPNHLPPDLTLMEFLIMNNITIASSCSGVGSCKKCVINKTILSCQISLKEFILNKPESIVEVTYL